MPQILWVKYDRLIQHLPLIEPIIVEYVITNNNSVGCSLRLFQTTFEKTRLFKTSFDPNFRFCQSTMPISHGQSELAGRRLPREPNRKVRRERGRECVLCPSMYIHASACHMYIVTPPLNSYSLRYRWIKQCCTELLECGSRKIFGKNVCLLLVRRDVLYLYVSCLHPFSYIVHF